MRKKCGINHNVVHPHDNIITQQLIPTQGRNDLRAINQSVTKSQLTLEKCDEFNRNVKEKEAEVTNSSESEDEESVDFRF